MLRSECEQESLSRYGRDEELRKRYNPDLQKRAAEQGDRRAQEFDDYVHKLKELLARMHFQVRATDPAEPSLG
jgi:hypothetical protein